MSNYHDPVMLKECLDGLKINPNGIYVDVTFGGGGHSRRILEQLGENGKLIAFDQDPDAWENDIDDERFILIKENFRYIKRFLKFNGYAKVDGVLADLGVSSYQFDTDERGFSIRFDGPLDMRMSPSIPRTAKSVLEDSSQKELADIFFFYGEVQNARRLASVIKNADLSELNSTMDLVNLVAQCIKGKRNQYLAKVFQALRIEVNEELDVLKEFLKQTPEILNEEGRLVVMSYHSLEDRLVKNFVKTGDFKGKQEKDFYGNLIRPLKPVSRKAIIASEEELKENPRARSAKLRIAEL